MNEFARQLDRVVRYGRDHEQIAAAVEGAAATGFKGPLLDLLMETDHPLAKVAEVVARDGSVGNINTNSEHPEASLFRRALGGHAAGKVAFFGPYLTGGFNGDPSHPIHGRELPGRSAWSLSVKKGKHPTKGDGFFVAAALPRYHKWEQVHLDSGPIWHNANFPHHEVAFLQPHEMEATLHGIISDAETAATTKKAAATYLKRHFKKTNE